MFNLFRDNIVFKNEISISNNFNNDDWKKSFRAQNVGFFDFILNESYDSNDVIQVEKNVYYKNVYFFVKKIKNVVNIYTIKKIKFNLSNCLKKTIQIWYIESLNDFEKKNISIVEHQNRKMMRRFDQKIQAIRFVRSAVFFIEKLFFWQFKK